MLIICDDKRVFNSSIGLELFIWKYLVVMGRNCSYCWFIEIVNVIFIGVLFVIVGFMILDGGWLV